MVPTLLIPTLSQAQTTLEQQLVLDVVCEGLVEQSGNGGAFCTVDLEPPVTRGTSSPQSLSPEGNATLGPVWRRQQAAATIQAHARHDDAAADGR